MPTRKEIKQRVIEKIAAVIDEPVSAVSETDKLWEKFGMGPTVRRAMALPYSKIALSYEGGRAVSQADAEKQQTVKTSIDLVTSRAQGKA
jgi:hypothetical protein